MTESDFHHISVLPQETLKFLEAENTGKYVDCTLGGGGHTGLILQANAQSQVLGLDCDEVAMAAAKERLSQFGERFECRRINFREISSLKGDPEWSEVDGILMDIGVSSHHLDEASRGFSYRNDGPLDMRMDNRLELTASKILNEWSERELKRIFRVYGEERQAGRIAKEVVRRRADKLWTTTGQFAGLCDEILGRGRKRSTLPNPTRCFQALRIAVNDELGALEDGLKGAFELLKTGGRLVVISFHSLEDRIVKNFFKELALDCICPPDLPVCRCDKRSLGKVMTGKPVIAGKEELETNSRSSCAKLRAFKKL